MAAGTVFIEISLIIAIAVVVSAIVRAFKQPLIIGYIIAGILVSPYFFNLVTATESLSTFAQMGVAVLLFMVGLNLDPKVAKEVGKVAIITGIGQIIFTFVFGFLIANLLGFTYIESAYIAIALTFSSTIVIMKLLSDKGDTNTLYGKISIGFLIVQDLVAILILMVVSSISGDVSFSSIALQKVLTGIGLIGGLFLFSWLVLKPLTRVIAKSQELLLLFSIGWAFSLASLFDFAGFSIEIGALLAGISLSVSQYRYEMSSKMKPLRDFFLLLFFVALGSQITFGSLHGSIVPIILFSAFVFIGNPIIVMTLMGMLGYTKRNGFLCGLTVSQISEFSLILVTLAVTVGHVSQEILSMLTIIGLITMASSSYAILNGKKLYHALSPVLKIFEKSGRKVDEGKYHREQEYDVILFGYNRVGYSLEKTFKKMKKKFLIVDNNPDTILRLAHLGIDCRYGDAEDLELLEELPMKEAEMIISTIPDMDTNLLLLSRTKAVNEKASFMAVSHQIDDALTLYEAGATYVITPHFFGGDYTAHLLEKHGLSKTKFKKEASRNTQDLLQRKREGHKDPLHERD